MARPQAQWPAAARASPEKWVLANSANLKSADPAFPSYTHEKTENVGREVNVHDYLMFQMSLPRL